MDGGPDGAIEKASEKGEDLHSVEGKKNAFVVARFLAIGLLAGG